MTASTTIATGTGVPTLLLTKNPGLFQDPCKNFSIAPVWSSQMFKYKEKMEFNL